MKATALLLAAACIASLATSVAAGPFQPPALRPQDANVTQLPLDLPPPRGHGFPRNETDGNGTVGQLDRPCNGMDSKNSTGHRGNHTDPNGNIAPEIDEKRPRGAKPANDTRGTPSTTVAATDASVAVAQSSTSSAGFIAVSVAAGVVAVITAFEH